MGHFDYRNLITTPTILDTYAVDFSTVTLTELHDITMPFNWRAGYTGLMHGIAGWFDLIFAPPPYDVLVENTGTTIELSTGPAAERTHWQQVRFLFKQPLAVNATQKIRGWMRAVVNDMRSYTIFVEVVLGDSLMLSDPASIDQKTFATTTEDEHPLRRRGRWELHEQTYNYSFTPGLLPDHKPEYSCLYPPESNIQPTVREPSMQVDVMGQYENFIN